MQRINHVVWKVSHMRFRNGLTIIRWLLSKTVVTSCGF